MSHLQDPKNRTCPACQKKEPEVRFYRRTEECRTCIAARANSTPLDDKLAKYVEEKERKRLLRAELRAIAKKRLREKKAQLKKAREKKRVKHLVESALKPAPPAVDVDPVQKELAARIMARRRLIEFVKQFHPRYKAGWVHHDICARLEKFAEDVEAGKSPRLMILMPPRHGKSQIASKLYPAWHLGHYPHHEFIACSYNISLALEFSREVRGVLRSPKYQNLFPKTKLDPEFQSAETWKILSPTGVGGGGYVAAGIGGGINGKGAHVLVIDDPIKNAQEAESAETREGIWNWYTSTAYTRLAPGGGILVIQTWWHDDDLAGRLQEEMKDATADQWEVVKYPAIAEEDEEWRPKGAALHEDRYNIEQLLKIQRTLGGPTGRYWSALYQQNPVPADGAYFTRDMFVERTKPVNTDNMYIYIAWDFAISEKRHADWNVGNVIGVDSEDMAHLLQVDRFKTKDSAEIVDRMLDMFQAYQKQHPRMTVEDGQIWRAMEPLFRARAKKRGLYPTVEPQTPITDKQVRARPLQGRMTAKQLTFSPKMENFVELKKELLRFPAGAHDDIVDSLAWNVSQLMTKAPPSPPRPPKNRREKTVAEKLRAYAMGQSGSESGHMGA